MNEFWHTARIPRRRGRQPGYLRQCRRDLLVFLLENSLFTTDYFCLRLQVTFALGLQYAGWETKKQETYAVTSGGQSVLWLIFTGPGGMVPLPPPGSTTGLMTRVYFCTSGRQWLKIHQIHLIVLHLLHSVNDHPVADLHSKILDGCPRPHQSNFLQFHAIFGKILWPNKRLLRTLPPPPRELAPPLGNLGSATGWLCTEEALPWFSSGAGLGRGVKYDVLDGNLPVLLTQQLIGQNPSVTEIGANHNQDKKHKRAGHDHRVVPAHKPRSLLTLLVNQNLLVHLAPPAVHLLNYVLLKKFKVTCGFKHVAGGKKCRKTSCLTHPY